MRWFKDGDRNTKFYHTYVKGRRKKLHIGEIQSNHGDVFKTNDQIGGATVDFFEDQFREADVMNNLEMIDNIPRVISVEQNDEMEELPSLEEIKTVVYKLNGDNTSGLDGFSGAFFQVCREIINEDISKMTLPRPISLSTFINKIISRLIHERIANILPALISPNQSGFIRGRSITENVLLAQEIIRDINLRNKWQNVVVKLDLAKAYDRVSWIFLTKSSRGLKQGDPLSPTLFIITAEVLARGLNKLHEDGDKKSVKKMMKVLVDYEQVSGQMINKNKYFFYLHEKAHIISGQRLRRWTGIQQGHFPFTYLGCPVFNGRKKVSHFEYILGKINKRVMCWQNKFLSYGIGYKLIVGNFYVEQVLQKRSSSHGQREWSITYLENADSDQGRVSNQRLVIKQTAHMDEQYQWGLHSPINIQDVEEKERGKRMVVECVDTGFTPQNQFLPLEGVEKENLHI
ncbi:hypothetical protein KY284_013279 [Solanum tuberosum]|nr:hypothetical protein KY284_013279 [Solanum tuberosum]